ncbi:MAG TPA: hypothetical protein VFZ61_22045, partial [Polyangiales bacterium]
MKRTLVGPLRTCALACWLAAGCSEADVEGESDGAEPIEAVDAARNASTRDASQASADSGSGAQADAATPMDGAATLDASASSDAGARDASARDARTEAAGDAAASDAAATTDAGGSSDAGADPSGWKLVWSDEFDGPPGSLLNASRWVYE